MTQPPSANSGGAAPLSLGQRFIGMLFSPKATFESVVSWPRWLGMLALTTAITVVAIAAFMMSDVGRDIILKQQLDAGASQETAEMAASIGRYFPPIAVLIFMPLMTFAVAGILMGVFAVTGGSASYKQVLAVYVHSGVIGTVMGAVNALLNYLRATDTNITSLAGIGNAFAEKGFVAGFFSALDLVIIWSVFVLAVGLAVLYRRRTPPIFMALMAVYLLIAVVVGAVKAAFAGGS